MSFPKGSIFSRLKTADGGVSGVTDTITRLQDEEINNINSILNYSSSQTQLLQSVHTTIKMAHPTSLILTLTDLSKMIDHSLLHPTLTDAEVSTGLTTCKTYNVSTACIKPYHIPYARKLLEGTTILLCPVIGFPHGNSTTETKAFEAVRALEEGGTEIDMVVNVGRVLSGKWEYVTHEIKLVNEAVVRRGGILKVIFENDCK